MQQDPDDTKEQQAMTTTTVPAIPAELALALTKDATGAPLTVHDRKLVALELARRAHDAASDTPTDSHEWVLLRRVATGPDLEGRFTNLVAAFDDWAEVDSDVDSWRFQADPPMSRDGACEYVTSNLIAAVDALIVVPAAVAS